MLLPVKSWAQLQEVRWVVRLVAALVPWGRPLVLVLAQ